jgi:hypothetical protein
MTARPGPAPSGPPPGGPQSPPIISVKPHKKLFVSLCLIFAAWIGLLIWIYFSMVRPMRHSGTP